MVYFRKQSSGWEYRISYKDMYGNYKQKSKRGFKTKSEAKLAANLAEQDILNKTFEDKNITLTDYFSQWLETYKKQEVDPETYQKYKFFYKIIKKHFKTAKLADITATQYQKVFNELGETYVKSTLKRLNSSIRQALKVALHEGKIKKDFTALVKIHSSVESKKASDKFLELEDYLAFINNVRKTVHFQSSFFAYLVAKTGLRFSEAQALTNDNDCINRKELYINITQTYKVNGARRGWGKTKNPQSVRRVPIDEELLEALDEYLEKGFIENEDNRLFTRVSNTSINKLIKKRTQTKITCHGLRHTYVSYLIYHDINVVSIASIVGHKDATKTLKTYSHLFAKKQENIFDTIRQLF